MIRISRRKQAGTRRNKRHKGAQTALQRHLQSIASTRSHNRHSKRNHGGTGHSFECFTQDARGKLCQCNPFDHNSKPYHHKRTVIY